MADVVDLNDRQRLDNTRKDDSRAYFLHIICENVEHTTRILGTTAANTLFYEIFELLDEGPNAGIHWFKIDTYIIRIRDIIYISLEEAQ